MELRGNTALVTGASGFVGGHVARRLADAEGMKVRALVRNLRGKQVVSLSHPYIELVKGDILDPSSLGAASAGVKLVFHAAASNNYTTRKNAWATGVDGTRNLYEATRTAGVERLIFMSSFSVYLGATGQCFDEGMSLERCGDLYADAKIAAEELLGAPSSSRPDVIILRAPAIYGPGSWFWTLRFVHFAKQGRLFLPNRGEFFIPYVYIENLVDAIVLAARMNSSGGTYNIFDDHIIYRDFVGQYAQMVGIGCRDLSLRTSLIIAAGADIISRLSGWWIPISLKYMKFLTSGYYPGVATADKAKREFGWLPQMNFEEGILRTQTWLDENGYLG